MQKKFLAILRIAMGWTFLWPFFDKLFGLSFSTKPEGGWINGGSPTYGFLTFGTRGPFAEFFQSLAGYIWLDWVFMLSLLLIGLALIFGVGIRLASFGATIWMISMYMAASIPPEHNPFLDEHIVNLVIVLVLSVSNAGDTWGLGRWWNSTKIVQKYKFL